ncbi:hypothetical protein E2562_008520 [Oryza meyeriana var. granulata]|uniref:Uncharacterized protein n=1 Tax=Oryza meyeriana var. granulata TaxID=110450 RepID=A0A6G1C4L6_9ORYZ|nr:hypothetical protein E2562_008520 [Oryza meyeriana var. granulata]
MWQIMARIVGLLHIVRRGEGLRQTDFAGFAARVNALPHCEIVEAAAGKLTGAASAALSVAAAARSRVAAGRTDSYNAGAALPGESPSCA